MTADCPFCGVASGNLVANSAHSIALPDAFPVARSHTLVMPRRHVLSIFDLPREELDDVWALVATVRSAIAEQSGASAFTIGVNDGPAAGQTVPHGHIHVIPRRHGDVPDPRGGVRWVLPPHAAYWSR